MILNKRDREAIVKFAKERAFTEEMEAFKKEAAVFVEKVRVAWNGGEEMCRQVDSLPTQFFRTANGIPDWQLAGAMFTQPEWRAVAANPAHSYSRSRFQTEKDTLANRWKDIDAKRSALGRDLEQSLLALRTTKKIREAYPEFAGMLPDEASTNVPAVWVDMEAVRAKLLGAGVIPVEEQKSA